MKAKEGLSARADLLIAKATTPLSVILQRFVVLSLAIGLMVACQSSRNRVGIATRQSPAGSVSPGGSQILPDTAVITIKGLCDIIPAPETEDMSSAKRTLTSTAVATRPDCGMIVTRQELESLGHAMGTKPDRLLALANAYSNMLQFATKGYELGIVKDRIFQQRARYNYLQSMAQYAIVAMQNRADDFTDSDLEKYYREHAERFVQADISQLAVPKHKLHLDDSGIPVHQSNETLAAEMREMKKVANTLQQEAVKGADFDNLEARAYKAALDSGVPGTDLGTRFDDMVPLQYRKLIFDLNDGQVSPVTEDENEYLIFKVRKKRMLPLSESRHWYGQLIMREMRRDLAARVKVEYNDQFFAAVKNGSGADSDNVTATLKDGS
jgi:parvulin-like peptidyl-prolyl cis-trans isomerase-like protein